MSLLLNYKDTATFIKASTGVYADSKTVESEAVVPVIFLQNTGYNRSNFQENVDSDAICYPDHSNQFIIDNFNRLEGMYVVAPLFDASYDEGWYKVVSVTVNRDHLLSNNIDNIELRLKKTKKIQGVS